MAGMRMRACRGFYLKAVLGAVIAVMLCLGGCAPAPPSQTAFMEKMGVEDVTGRELQLMLYAFAVQFEGTVELAANEIQQSTDSPAIEYNAILWKVNGVPLIYRAAFNTDPLGGLISAWSMCAQMREFFETGAGADVFGDWQDIAIEAARNLESDIADLAAGIMDADEFATLRDDVNAWALAHPFDNMLLAGTGNSTEFLRSLAGESVGGLGAAASMNVELRTMNDRLAVLTAYIPRQVQAQTELLMAQAPELVAGERDSIMAAVEANMMEMLGPLMEFWAHEREVMTTYITDERSAVLGALADERLAALQALSDERTEVLKRLSEERNLTIEQINAATLTALDRMLAESENLSESAIDHVFLRTVQLMAIPALVVLVFFVAVLLWVRNSINRYLRLLEERTPGAGGRQ